MNKNEVDRDERVRIENQKRLLELAGIYKKLSRRDLAEALGRDGSKLVRANGNPKLDYVVRLAEVLDWPVGDVVEAIWGGGAAPPAGDGQQDFEALDEAAMAAHRCGDYARLCELAHRMTAVAAAPDQVALAALREAGGWDGLGRYARLLEAVRRGLQEGPTCPELRLLLQVNFANAHYTLWYLFEARAMARDLIDGFRQIPARTRGARAAEAFAHYILGHTWRRLIAKQPEHAEASARAALDALRESHRLYTELAAEFDHAPWRGIAHTCLGGMLEVEAVLGIRPPHAAVGALAEALEAVRGPEDGLSGDRLESYGWWCIFACNIALRHLEERDLQRHVTTFAKKGYAIADRLDNWAMRERLFTLEYLQRQQLNDLAGFSVDWTISNETVRAIVGTMGRFPAFRTTAWRILQTAAIVEST